VSPSPERTYGTVFQTIAWILDDLCLEDGFDLAVLIGPEGLPLAQSDTEGDPEQLAAVTDIFRRSALQLREHLAWPELDEIRLVTRGKMNLIGQVFSVQEETLILALVLSKRKPYRHATSQAIEYIRLAWESHSTT
jgi:hypothetical protein